MIQATVDVGGGSEAMPVNAESVAGRFLASCEFKKKAIGGLDEIDVLGKIEELAALYEERLAEVCGSATDSRREAAEYSQRIAALEAALAAEKLRADELEEHSSDVAKLLLSVQEAKEDILGRANEEAASAREQAQREARRLLVEAEGQVGAMRQAAEAELSELLARGHEEAERVESSAARRVAESEARVHDLEEQAEALRVAIREECEGARKAIDEAMRNLALAAADLDANLA